MATGSSVLEGGTSSFKLRATEAKKLNKIEENRLQHVLKNLDTMQSCRSHHLGQHIVHTKFEVEVMRAEREKLAITRYMKGHIARARRQKQAKQKDERDMIKPIDNDSQIVVRRKVREQTPDDQNPSETGQTLFKEAKVRSLSSKTESDSTLAAQLKRSAFPPLENGNINERQFSSRTFPLTSKKKTAGRVQENLLAPRGTLKLPNIAWSSDLNKNKILDQYHSCISRGHCFHKKLELDPPKIKFQDNDIRQMLHTFPPILKRKLSHRLPPILPPSQQRLKGTGKFRAAVRAIRSVSQRDNV